MTKKRTFISFDYDHDLDLKNLLVGQAKNEDSPFEIADFSIKEAVAKDWKEKARARIKSCDVVIFICGESTHTATGVDAEMKITRDEAISYFLLKGRSDKTCTKPSTSDEKDKMYKWTWDNLKLLINGAR
jgi:hypothetical protein